MAYPFGFSPEFHAYYFRSVFIPVVLFAVTMAALFGIKGFDGIAAALTLALMGMPMLYQFQANDLVPWDVNWGMVDNFLASVAGLSAAAVLRSVRGHSAGWGVLAALSAAFCFLIKPSGVMVMALTGLAWLVLLLWQERRQLHGLLRHPLGLRFTAPSLAAALAIYGVTAYVALTSEYFSAENVLFGNRVIAIMSGEVTAPVTPADFFGLVRISLGWALTALTVLGLGAALYRGAWAAFSAALLCLGLGVWFWFFATEPWEPRYFVPFGVMAFVFVAPLISDWVRAGAQPLRRIYIIALSTPLALVTILLMLPSPPLQVQRALGVNLVTGLFEAETVQAKAVLGELRAAGAQRSAAYFFNITPAQRAFQAVLNHTNLVDPRSPQMDVLSPIDWQRPSTFRIEDLTRAEFLVFEPVRDGARRAAILSQRTVPDFYTEAAVFTAWASALTPSQGVMMLSDTSLRILKVTDRAALEDAFQDLVQRHDWPAAFMDSNQPRWWSANGVDALVARNSAATVNAVFALAEAPETHIAIRAARARWSGTLFDLDVWAEGSARPPWVMFAHIVDGQGKILKNAQTELIDYASPNAAQTIRRYTFTYTDLPANAAGVALGLFSPKGPELDFLRTDSGTTDWDGRRLIVPLGRIQN
ncbi:MAG: hypothetical protein JNK21_15620 [Rhodospirillaceae bacterium]|nr:hypothetical protein [Rhodospirillaceae bacterium]